MRKLIQFTNTGCNKYIKGDKMSNNFVLDIQKKENNIKEVPKVAESVLKNFEVNDLTSGVPIVEILNNLGFKIFQSNLEPDGLSAYIAVDPTFEEYYGSNKIIFVDTKGNIGHKRFALAHELAHYLFDFNGDENLCYYNTYFPESESENEEEMRANCFAANLLMPEREFQKKFEQYKNNQSKADIVSTLSRYFLVSPTAVLKRFKELGIEGYEQ